MKIGIAVACFLLIESLGAQTKSLSPQTSAESRKASPTNSVEPLKIDSAKEADIRRLMDLVGTRVLVTQMMDSMEENIKPLMTNSFPPGEYREKLIDLFFAKFHSKAGAQQLLDLAVPAYDKYYTHEEIKGLIEFYRTPLGQKMVAVLPRLMADLQSAGQKWGGQLGQDCMTEVLSEHPDLAKALEAAKTSAQPQ